MGVMIRAVRPKACQNQMYKLLLLGFWQLKRRVSAILSLLSLFATTAPKQVQEARVVGTDSLRAPQAVSRARTVLRACCRGGE